MRRRIVHGKANADRTAGLLGTVSGAASVASSYTLCHNICLAAIAFLSFFGITAAGMPLAFLQQYAPFFWSAALLFLVISLSSYFSRKACFSKNLLVANTGIVIIGVPFPQLAAYAPAFWTAGGLLIAAAAVLYLRQKIS